MHRILYTTRRIPAAELPRVRDISSHDLRDATDAELLNFGLARIRGDFFSCCEQQLGELIEDAVTGELRRNWIPHPDHIAPGGDELGLGADRYAGLRAEDRVQILRARVVQATEPGVSVHDVIAASLGEQAAAIAENVGPIDGRTLVDLGSPDAQASEADRLSAIPASGVEACFVTMADTDPARQVVLETNVVPQQWAGERVRRPT